jgi:hypothetical protein
MYVPTKNFPEPPDQDIYCEMTGESYSWVDVDDVSLLPSHLAPGALERLPNRFYQHPKVINNGNQIKVLFVPITPDA